MGGPREDARTDHAGDRSSATGAVSSTDRVVLFAASLAYVGFVPVASGTVAVAVVGIPLYLLLTVVLELGWPAYTVFCAALTAAAIPLATRADRILREKDSSKSVIDEIPGFLIALIGLPVAWKIVAAAFFIQRAIDIAKVPPARWVEDRLPGGWGVVLDDVVAGLYALTILHIAERVWPGWWG